MLQITIVVFREILEIALIIGILSAATKNIAGRGKWIFGGVCAGILGASLLAFFTDSISASLDGLGQEFFNGLVLLAAGAMIGWTVLWMQKHAKSLSGELKRLGNSVREGHKPLYILAVIILLSVLREGAEIVLFSYSAYISGTEISQIIFGLVCGALLGSACGLALYFGLLKSFGRHFFSLTSWLLVFFAAGIISQGIGFWVDAGIAPALGQPAIDLSGILPQQSFVGKFLNLFFGYIDQPCGLQLIAYFASIAVLVAGLKIAKKM